MAGSRRSRLLLWSAAAIALVLASVVASVAFLAGTDAGRAWVARGVERAVGEPGVRSVKIGRIDGNLLGEFDINEVAVSDREGLWLAVRSISVSWRPGALLRGRLEVESVTAGSIALDRLPVSPADAEDAPFSFDLTPPIDIEVGHYAVRSLDIGAAVLGEPFAFEAKGGLRWLSDRTAALSLQTMQHGVAANRARVALNYDPAADRLDVDAAYDEASGGPVARLLAIEGLPALTMRVAGSGPVAGWRGKLSGSADGAGSVEATIDLARKDGLDFRLAGIGNTTFPEDELPWSALAGRTDFTLRGAWQSDGTVRVDQARLKNAAVTVDGTGAVEPSNGRIEARVRLIVADQRLYRAVAPDLTVKGLAVDATAGGSLDAPRITLRATSDRIETAQLTADSSETKIAFTARKRPAVGLGTGTLSVDGRIAGLDLPGADGLTALTGKAVDWSLEAVSDGGGKIRIERSRVAGKAMELTAKGSASAASGDAALTVALRLSDMATLGAVAGLTVTGRAEIGGPVSIGAFGDTVEAKLSGAAQALRFEEPALQHLLGGASELGATASFKQGRLAIDDLRLDSAAARLVANADFDREFSRIDGRYRVDLETPSALAEAMGVAVESAPLALDGSVSGAIANPALRGTVSGDRLSVGGQDFRKIALTYRLSDLTAALRGGLDLSARTPLGDATASAALMVKEGWLHVSDIRVESEPLSVRGEAAVPLDAGAVRGEAKFDVSSLRPLLSLAGIDGNGSGSARLVLSDKDGKPAAALRASARKVVLDPAGDIPVDVGSVTLALDVSDLSGRRDASAEMRVEELRRGGLTVADGKITATGTPRGGDVDINATGKWFGDLKLDAGGRVAADGATLSAEIGRLTGSALGQPVRLVRAARLKRGSESVAVDTLELEIGPGRLALSGEAGPDRLAVTASASALPLAVLRPLTGLDISGRLAGEASLTGSAAQPRGTARLTADKLRFGEDETLPPVDIAAAADWRGGRLSLDGTVAASKALQARLDAELPLRLDPRSMAVGVSAQGPLSGRLTWRGDIAEAWRLLPLDTHRLAGEANVDVRLGGTVATPKLTGGADLTGGRYENLLTGTVMNEMTAKIALQDTRAKIETLSARDGAAGSLEAGGQIALEPERGFPFDLRTTLRNFAAVRRDDVTAALSGEVGVGGTASAARVEGALTSETVEVRVLDTLPPEVVELDVVEVNAPAGDRARTAERRDRTGGTEIALGLSIDMPRRVFVRGRGIDSEWSGKLNVSGTAAEPRVVGKLTLVRGQVNVVGKTFKLNKGTVTFPPGKTVQPTIDVVATNRSGDLQTTVRVSGPATNPKITLSSVPELPQDEIISRILFKKSAAKLSGAEAIQLAAAVAELSGAAGSGPGLLDFARGALGVDVFRIDSSDTADGSAPALSVGKYLTDEVYLGVKQGLTPESSSVGVEVEVTPNISVDSSVRQSGASETGVKFKLDY